MSALNRAAAVLRELLWPRRVICLCCGRPSRGGHLCQSCDESLDALRITGPVCEICGHLLEDGQCVFCDRTGIATLRSVWAHRDESRRLVHLLKYDGVAEAAQPMANSIARLAQTMSLPPDTVVTWPTMPDHRKRSRGIDHGELLARNVGARLSLPVRQLMARSEKLAAEPQVGKGHEERLTRLRGAFTCPEPLNHPVLLVDDVLTTSATATTCAECLLDAGAVSVTVITATQAQMRRQTNDKEEPEDDMEEAADQMPDSHHGLQRHIG